MQEGPEIVDCVMRQQSTFPRPQQLVGVILLTIFIARTNHYLNY